MSSEIRFCVGCENNVEKSKMIDFTGYTDNLICGDCWNGFRPFERLLIFVLMKPVFENGLNAGTEIEEMLTIARRTFRAMHGHDSGQACNQCDPREVADQEIRRAAALAKKNAKGQL